MSSLNAGGVMSSASGGRPKIPETSHRVARSWWRKSSLPPTTSPCMLIEIAKLSVPSVSVPKSCKPFVESQMKAWKTPVDISTDPTI